MSSDLKFNPLVERVYAPDTRRGALMRPCQPVYRVHQPGVGVRRVWVVGESERNDQGVSWVSFLAGPAPGAEPVYIVGRD